MGRIWENVCCYFRTFKSTHDSTWEVDIWLCVKGNVFFAELIMCNLSHAIFLELNGYCLMLPFFLEYFLPVPWSMVLLHKQLLAQQLHHHCTVGWRYLNMAAIFTSKVTLLKQEPCAILQTMNMFWRVLASIGKWSYNNACHLEFSRFQSLGGFQHRKRVVFFLVAVALSSCMS